MSGISLSSGRGALLGRLEILKLVADLGGPFVIFSLDRFAQRSFEALTRRKRAFGADILQPILERENLAALFRRFRVGMLLMEGADLLDALFDLLHGEIIIVGF